ncbi:MAG: DUF2871 domain-containing protein [Erysipelotrichaceae bacterium]
MKIRKKYLLFIASVVWLIAGFNVLKIGLTEYKHYLSLINYLLSIVVFIPFGMMFFKISKKHNIRIHKYEEEYQYFFHFFDLKSFIIMVFMMTMGIVLRKFELVPFRFIAVFYTGLGAGLFLAGINFMYYFIQEINIDKQEGGFMKKYTNYAFSYAILAMIAGVFYREFTKFNGFTGKTSLGVAHVHLFALGTLLMLVLGLYCSKTDLADLKQFKIFWRLYNLALPFMVIMFIVRGIVQVLGVELAKGPNAAISGIAGISHILMAVSIVLLFLALKKTKEVK